MCNIHKLIFRLALIATPAYSNPINGQGTWESTLEGRDVDGDSSVDAPNIAVPLAADVDGDSNMDIVIGFRTQATRVLCGDTEIRLYGETFDETPVSGVDSIYTIDCAIGYCPQNGFCSTIL